METQAQAKQLWFHYTDENGERTSPDILKDISLSIDKGDFVALLGHNGSGKSTFAKHMNAILLPSAGTMTVDGIDTKDESQRFTLRSHVGMVFQNPDNQIVANVVEEDVGFGPENMGVPTEEIWKRVNESLKAVGMEAYRMQSPNKLSGGQKQRVAIARMLMKEAPILVFDDSLSAVDTETDNKIRKELKKEMEKATVIMISHRITSLMQADCIIVMDKGVIQQMGTHEELIHQEGPYKDIYEIQMNSDIRLMEGGAVCE